MVEWVEYFNISRSSLIAHSHKIYWCSDNLIHSRKMKSCREKKYRMGIANITQIARLCAFCENTGMIWKSFFASPKINKLIDSPWWYPKWEKQKPKKNTTRKVLAVHSLFCGTIHSVSVRIFYFGWLSFGVDWWNMSILL